MLKPKKINPNILTGKPKEVYNYAKVISILADYGYECCLLTNDWEGADFLANHKDHTLRIQMKSCTAFAKKYMDKDLHVIFPWDNGIWLYNHDKFLEEFPNILESKSWEKHETFSYTKTSKPLLEKLESSKHAIFID